MSWFLRKRKNVQDTQLLEVADKVQALEQRVDSITEVLIKKIDDPWSQGILRSIYHR